MTLLDLNHRGRPRGADGLAVNPTVNFAADTPYFVKHPKAVARNQDLAGGVVIPTDRDFTQSQVR